MGEYNVWPTLLVLAGVAFLTLGLIGGHVLWPQVETKEVTKEVPVTKTVEVPVEVIKEVTVEVQSPDSINGYLELAKAELLAEIDDNESLQNCGSVEYDSDQISINDVDDDSWVVTYDADRNGDLVTVDFTAELKYKDADTETKCYDDVDVSVTFEEDEDNQISVV